jgi:hypothetical protein
VSQSKSVICNCHVCKLYRLRQCAWTTKGLRLWLESLQLDDSWCFRPHLQLHTMPFVVKCCPVIKQWNGCCCLCELRTAALCLGWTYMVCFPLLLFFPHDVVLYHGENVISYIRHGLIYVMENCSCMLIIFVSKLCLILYSVPLHVSNSYITRNFRIRWKSFCKMQSSFNCTTFISCFLMTSLKSGLCKAITTQNNREYSCIISHAQNATTFRANGF